MSFDERSAIIPESAQAERGESMVYGERRYYVYIMSNNSKTLYVGVTNNPERRIWEHRAKVIKGFTTRYNITMLVHLEEYANPDDAIAREKQLKGWKRDRKLALIRTENPHWLDLAADWYPADTSFSPD